MEEATPAWQQRPDAFLRVEVGGVGREVEDGQPVRVRGDEVLHLRHEVGAQVVPDQDDGAFEPAVRPHDEVAESCQVKPWVRSCGPGARRSCRSAGSGLRGGSRPFPPSKPALNPVPGRARPESGRPGPARGGLSNWLASSSQTIQAPRAAAVPIPAATPPFSATPPRRRHVRSPCGPAAARTSHDASAAAMSPPPCS